MDIGLTLDEVRKMREELRQGLAELRQQVTRQEGAVMMIDEQIKVLEQRAEKSEDGA